MFEIFTLSGVWYSDLFFWVFSLGNEAKSTEIDSSISQAIRNSDKISITKNIFEGTVESTLPVEKFSSFKRNTIDVWKNYGYFKQQLCDFLIEKANLPENTIIYINQVYQSYKDNNKVYYVDYYLLGQVNQCLKPPEDLKYYECQPNKIKIYRPKYDVVIVEFLGLYETLGYLTVRGDNQECFFDYGYSKDNKVLYSHHKMKIPNSFSGTMFNRHRKQYELGTLNTDFSKVYFFFPSITDRIAKINRHIGSVNLVPIDIAEDSFKIEDGVVFDPYKLDYENSGKDAIKDSIFKVLKKMVDLSNSNLLKNADGLLTTKPMDQDVLWVGETSKRVLENQFALSY